MFDRESMTFLKELTEAVVESSRVRPGQSIGQSAANTTGGTLIRPGGRDCYPAFWVRDFAMSLESGCISAQEMVHHLNVLVKALNGATERHVGKSAVIPPRAVPDHINFDGSAV